MPTLRVIWLGIAALVAAISSASAQPYPNHLVRIVVPFSAGSITDNLARVIADKLQDMWKQQVIVENRPGLPGTTSVANAPADGYTLMLTSNGHTIARAVSKNVSFDPVKDFSGVTKVASVPLVMIVPPTLPVKTLGEFIALAKAKPGELNFSSAGLASTSFLSAEVMRQSANINIVHVPYKGVPEATTAVIRGDAQMYFAPIPQAQELSATGKVRAIAINSAARSPQLPDIPTVAEAGVAGYNYDSWFALMAPANTPREIVTRVGQDVGKILKLPDVAAKLVSLGAVPFPTTPEELDVMLKNDTERYAKVLRDAGIGNN